MRCDDVAELLLLEDEGLPAEAARHVQGCARCMHVAGGLQRLDSLLRASLVVEPPLHLQRQLAQLAIDASRPRPTDGSWWSRLTSGDWLGGLLTLRPNMVAAQGLAAVMLALAGWQVFGWLNVFRPVVGDVGYAVQLVAASPAVVYLGGLQIDLQSLGMWSVIGLCGWLISEDGPIGRRLAGRIRFP